MQVLEAANVCDLTDAANAKRDLDECKGRAERAEEDVKNLKNEWRGFKAVLAGEWSPNFRIFRAQDTSCNL
jgi:predicted translin family RNA/ssDNA-binding protein